MVGRRRDHGDLGNRNMPPPTTPSAAGDGRQQQVMVITCVDGVPKHSYNDPPPRRHQSTPAPAPSPLSIASRAATASSSGASSSTTAFGSPFAFLRLPCSFSPGYCRVIFGRGSHHQIGPIPSPPSPDAQLTQPVDTAGVATPPRCRIGTRQIEVVPKLVAVALIASDEHRIS